MLYYIKTITITVSGGDNMQMEYEANLFAVALLFDEQRFSTRLNYMSNGELESILRLNINEVY